MGGRNCLQYPRIRLPSPPVSVKEYSSGVMYPRGCTASRDSGKQNGARFAAAGSWSTAPPGPAASPPCCWVGGLQLQNICTSFPPPALSATRDTKTALSIVQRRKAGAVKGSAKRLSEVQCRNNPCPSPGERQRSPVSPSQHRPATSVRTAYAHDETLQLEFQNFQTSSTAQGQAPTCIPCTRKLIRTKKTLIAQAGKRWTWPSHNNRRRNRRPPATPDEPLHICTYWL